MTRIKPIDEPYGYELHDWGEHPTPFSKALPGLQLAWDATSLKSLMTCAKQYEYAHLEGWKASGLDVEFGGFYASGVEHYKRERLNGKSKIEATLSALRRTVEATWVRKGLGEAETMGAELPEPTFGPWRGEYLEAWRCTGTEPFRNSKGNRAKCPWSHKGHWFPGPSPDVCGTCGSPTEASRQWVPDNKTKNRVTLVRLLGNYLEEQPEDVTQGLYPYQFPDGTHAVELSFSMPLPIHVRTTGEEFSLAGHLDSISTFGSEHFITDNKTTKNPLDAKYWAQYSPNIQVDVYDFAGATLFQQLNIKGVAIEGAQTLVSGPKFGIGIAYRTDALREELLTDLEYWLGQAEKHAEEGHWPRNRANCFLCPFKKVCSAEPDRRQAILAESFTRQFWNPLAER